MPAGISSGPNQGARNRKSGTFYARETAFGVCRIRRVGRGYVEADAVEWARLADKLKEEWRNKSLSDFLTVSTFLSSPVCPEFISY
jgi:hypothetical protein